MDTQSTQAADNKSPHNYKQDALYAAIVIGMALSLVSTVLRFYARRKTIKCWRKDDWLMAAGLLWSFGVIAAIIHGLTVGLGDEKLTSYHDRLWLRRTNAAMLMFQNWCVFCVKTSILFFNMSIFPGRTFRRIAWMVIAVTAVNSFTGFLIAFLQELGVCPRADRQCFGEAKFVVPLTTGIISTVCDIVIYVMPIPVLAKLGVDRRTRIGLCCIFLLGLLCISTSFARWAAMIEDDPKDPVTMPSDPRIGLWTYVEVSAGITCGNLPILASILGCVGLRRRRQTGRSMPITLSHFNSPLQRSDQAFSRPVEQTTGASGNDKNNSQQVNSTLRSTETPSPLQLSFIGSDIELNIMSGAATNNDTIIPAEPPRTLSRDSSQRRSVLGRRRSHRAGFESLV